MKIDKTALDRLLSLDDVTLSRTIATLAAAAGIDKSSADAAASNLRLVRATLANASENDISQAIGMLGEDKVRALLAAIGRL